MVGESCQEFEGIFTWGFENSTDVALRDTRVRWTRGDQGMS